MGGAYLGPHWMEGMEWEGFGSGRGSVSLKGVEREGLRGWSLCCLGVGGGSRLNQPSLRRTHLWS